MNLFVYGTLMFPEVRRRVAAREFRWTTATLAGYRRGRVRGEVFPAIAAASPQDVVRGEILFDVSRAELALFDAYEADFYVRRTVEVVVEAGLALCEAYVVPERWEGGAWADGAWDPNWFRREALDAYVAHLDCRSND